MSSPVMSTSDFAHARELMVEQQVRPWDVLDTRVLDVLATLPRDAFVPEACRALAYADLQLPLGHGEVMLKPILEGRALQSLALQAHEDALEIGTGSGWFAACMGRLARSVTSIEIRDEFAVAARARLATQGLGNVEVEIADAMHYAPGRQFDAVCVSGAVDVIPARFLEWLRPGGRMFVVRGRAPVMEAVLLTRGSDPADVRIESLFETELPYLAGAAPAPSFDW
ncbi:MAG TPA: protein-L-isoaspartate O-methyltransferase [Luteimonas sp.]|nr:protein-L-isoaspartate O-methyltransferase [Luteimonas sp.]